MLEYTVQDYIHERDGGKVEIPIEAGPDKERIKLGSIDILTNTHIVECKKISDWKHSVGQILVYHTYHPGRRMKLVLFGDVSSDILRNEILSVCNKLKIEVEFIERLPDSFPILDRTEHLNRMICRQEGKKYIKNDISIDQYRNILFMMKNEDLLDISKEYCVHISDRKKSCLVSSIIDKINFDDLKLDHLKSMCDAIGEPKTGNKNDIRKRLIDYKFCKKDLDKIDKYLKF